MRIKLLVLVFVLSCFSFSSQALNVGVLIFDPPYVYSSSEGFDIDLTHDICRALKTKCKLFFMNYTDFFPALDSGKIDFAIGGIFISPSPKYIFSLPYVVGLSQFMTLKSSPYKTVADLKGTKVGVIKGNPSGSFFVDSLLQSYPGLFSTINYNNVNDLVIALNDNVIAAAFLRRSSVKYWTQNDASFRALGPVHDVGTGIGIMSTPQHKALIQQINAILLMMEGNNSYINLYKTYFYYER